MLEQGTLPTAKRRKGAEARGAAAIPIIAEDGDDLTEGRQGRAKLSTKNPLSGSAHARLGNLLEEPSPSRYSLQQTPRSAPANSTAKRFAQHIDTTPVNPKRPIQAHNTSCRRPRAIISQILNDEGITPAHEPYRALPLHKLSLEHFKINPNNNQGLDYAYADVVRKRDERRCLPGCTRPECCGKKFRALAEAGLPMKRSSLIFLNSSPVDEADADRQLLEEYLGTDRERLQTMSAGKKAELLLEAKTKQLAQIYGKHRHAHERPKSPPGFWRTDMPGTQEVEQDRMEAQKRIRQMVEERRREAVRGGLWRFADE